MNDNSFVLNILAENRKRLVGSLMSYLEMNVYPDLDVPEQKALREKVLTSVGAYHDAVRDIVKASVNDGSVQNELVLEAIAELHRSVKALDY